MLVSNPSPPNFDTLDLWVVYRIVGVLRHQGPRLPFVVGNDGPCLRIETVLRNVVSRHHTASSVISTHSLLVVAPFRAEWGVPPVAIRGFVAPMNFIGIDAVPEPIKYGVGPADRQNEPNNQTENTQHYQTREASLSDN